MAIRVSGAAGGRFLRVAGERRMRCGAGISRALAVAFVCVFSSVSVAQTTGAGSMDQQIAAAVAKVDPHLDQFKQKLFVAYDAHYVAERAARGARARSLNAEIFAREGAGKDMRLPHRMMLDAAFYLLMTADFTQADRRMDDLQRLLEASATQPATRPANPAAIVLPPYTTVWFLQLDAACDQLQKDKSFAFPPEILERINTPEKLAAYFKMVGTSDIARDGTDHLEQQNEPLADLTRLILRHEPASYRWDPGMRAALLEIVLHQARDPVTGYWGERYVAGSETIFVPDISTTFHMVSYLDEAGIDVPDLDRVVETTLDVKDRDTPVGWSFQGQQYNHNDMDVMELFKWGWPHASEDQRKRMAGGIEEMVHRCISESLQPDGSFKHIAIDSSVEESEYYGASLLVRAGFFHKANRFWTDQDTPTPDFQNADEIKSRIIGFINKHLGSGASGGVFYQSALNQLRTGKV